MTLLLLAIAELNIANVALLAAVLHLRRMRRANPNT